MRGLVLGNTKQRLVMPMKKSRQQTYYESASAEVPALTSSAPLQLPHQRQGDRGDSDDAAAVLATFVRYQDLVKAGIVQNRVTLARLINQDGFPTGYMIGRNTRLWALADVEAWIASRPTARKEIPSSVIEAAVAGRAAARAKAEPAS